MKHPLMQFFQFKDLPEGGERDIGAMMSLVAKKMDNTVPQTTEKTAGMRKLLEAKDCFVRAHIEK